MCLEGKKCIAWISLQDLGMEAEGCSKDSTWLASVPIQSHQSLFNPHIYIDLPDKKLTWLRTVSHGKFGSIDEVLFETSTKTDLLYAKRPILPGKNLICLHL